MIDIYEDVTNHLNLIQKQTSKAYEITQHIANIIKSMFVVNN